MAPDPVDANPASLPRSFRGYDRQATEQLFRRIAWDYSVLAGEHRKLKQAVGDAPAVRPRRVDLSDEAHSLLAAAHKAARELRDSARADCDQALKKARRRAAEIEQEAERSATAAVAVLDAAAALRSTLSEALRRLEGADSFSSPPPAEPRPNETAHPSSPL